MAVTRVLVQLGLGSRRSGLGRSKRRLTTDHGVGWGEDVRIAVEFRVVLAQGVEP